MEAASEYSDMFQNIQDYYLMEETPIKIYCNSSKPLSATSCHRFGLFRHGKDSTMECIFSLKLGVGGPYSFPMSGFQPDDEMEYIVYYAVDEKVLELSNPFKIRSQMGITRMKLEKELNIKNQNEESPFNKVAELEKKLGELQVKEKYLLNDRVMLMKKVINLQIKKDLLLKDLATVEKKFNLSHLRAENLHDNVLKLEDQVYHLQCRESELVSNVNNLQMNKNDLLSKVSDLEKAYNNSILHKNHIISKLIMSIKNEKETKETLNKLKCSLNEPLVSELKNKNEPKSEDHNESEVSTASRFLQRLKIQSESETIDSVKGGNERVTEEKKMELASEVDITSLKDFIGRVHNYSRRSSC